MFFFLKGSLNCWIAFTWNRKCKQLRSESVQITRWLLVCFPAEETRNGPPPGSQTGMLEKPFLSLPQRWGRPSNRLIKQNKSQANKQQCRWVEETSNLKKKRENSPLGEKGLLEARKGLDLGANSNFSEPDGAASRLISCSAWLCDLCVYDGCDLCRGGGRRVRGEISGPHMAVI